MGWSTRCNDNASNIACNVAHIDGKLSKRLHYISAHDCRSYTTQGRSYHYGWSGLNRATFRIKQFQFIYIFNYRIQIFFNEKQSLKTGPLKNWTTQKLVATALQLRCEYCVDSIKSFITLDWLFLSL